MSPTLNRALFSSARDDWETPPDFFAALDAVFDFQLDAAASAHNAKCARYFSADADSLAQPWAPHKRVWLNPPYGRAMGRWMRKAFEESRKGCVVVCLVPARTDTRWWHDWVQDKALVTFVRGRLMFRNPRNQSAVRGRAAFPSAVVVYGFDLAEMLNRRVDTNRIGRQPGAWAGFGAKVGAAAAVRRRPGL